MGYIGHTLAFTLHVCDITHQVYMSSSGRCGCMVKLGRIQLHLRMLSPVVLVVFIGCLFYILDTCVHYYVFCIPWVMVNFLIWSPCFKGQSTVFFKKHVVCVHARVMWVNEWYMLACKYTVYSHFCNTVTCLLEQSQIMPSIQVTLC